MTTLARLDLKLDVEEKDFITRAASLVGTTVAAIVRTAVKEKAAALLAQEGKVQMSQRDFAQFSNAIEDAFKPNKALKGALAAAAQIKRA